ncbi:MAG: hypothetical protein ACT4PP_12025 [Sporichthyaceae bacterium]
MTTTTIKVEAVVRDRIAAVARARGISMGALLDVESRRLAEAERWSQIQDDCERLRRDDPAGWADYLQELSDVAIGEGDPAAAQEWPEYNA